MTHKYQQGQRCRIVNAKTHPHLEGELTTIVDCAGFTEFGPMYRILLPPQSNAEYAVEECLVPLYDGNEPCAWTDCVWKPEKVTA